MPSTTPIQQLPYPVPGDTVDVPRDVKALADKLDPLGYAPIGAMVMWPGAAAPTGWLLMQGQVNLPAATYPGLATLLGVNAGMLAMPDMRDRVPLGVGEAALVATGGQRNTQLAQHNHVAVNGGTHTHQIAAQNTGIESADHSHTTQTFPTTYSAGGQNAANMGVFGTGGVNLTPGTSGRSTAHTHTVPSQLSAADGDHTHAINNAGVAAPDNRPPFVAVNFIIRAG
jgi:microcystin-dependent protein